MIRPISLGLPFRRLMKNGTAIWNGQHAVDRTLAAMQEMERYCTAHPQSPAAMRRPRLSDSRPQRLSCCSGPAIEEGVAGFGDSVQAALRAFDVQYSRSLTPFSDRDSASRLHVIAGMMWMARMRL